MPDPEVQTPPEFQFYVQQNGLQEFKQREFDRNTLAGLQKSLSKAHDNLHKQVRINTTLYSQLTKAERRLDRYSIMLWILVPLVTAEGCAIGWLLTELFSRI